MKLERICPTCKESFVAIKSTQLYDRRSCFKKALYIKNRDILREEQALPVFPRKTCAFCQTVQMIPYDPIKQPERFNSWECSNCGVTNSIIWKYQESPHSYQIISDLLSTMEVHSYLLTRPTEFTVRATFLTIVTGGSSSQDPHHIPPAPVKKRHLAVTTGIPTSSPRVSF